MRLVRKLPSEKRNGVSVSLGLFYCPQCKAEVKRTKWTGKASTFCSHACLTASGQRRINSKYQYWRKKQTCDLCGKVGNSHEITRYKGKYQCGSCLNGDLKPLDIDQYCYSGVTNIGNCGGPGYDDE